MSELTDLIGGLQRILHSFKCECDEDHWRWLKLPCSRCAGLSNLKRLSVLNATSEIATSEIADGGQSRRTRRD